MDWKKHILTFVVIFLLMGLLLSGRGACPGQQARQPIRPPNAKLVTIELAGKPGYAAKRSYEIRCEVADTKDQKQRGLGGRPGLEPGYGMLYVYDPPQEPEFSEARTGFALSLAFLKADGTITKIQRTAKNDRRVVAPDEPVTYVLEVRSGWFEDRNVRVGARFLLPPELTEPPGKAKPAEPSPQSGTDSAPAG